jgi:hypothetical protein
MPLYEATAATRIGKESRLSREGQRADRNRGKEDRTVEDMSFAGPARPVRSRRNGSSDASSRPSRRAASGPLLALAGLFLFPACQAAPNVSAPAETVVGRAADLAGQGATVLPADFVRAMLARPDLRDNVAAAQARVAKAPPGARNTRRAVEGRALLRSVERAFILDPGASTLDLLPPADRAKYESFQWDEDDYPGGPVGPHEDEALALDAALAKIRTERRANSTVTAVVTKPQFTEDVWKYIQAQERPVPGKPERKLNRYALASFVSMRDAAKKDGVDIVILSANRDPQVAARNAARTANAFAVASFSSHILGLAMDLRMSQGAQKYDEAATRPMTNIVAMRSSPVHKWLFVHGAEYGWFPYTHEPWHWEYNPAGFRPRFWKDFPGGIPAVEMTQ